GANTAANLLFHYNKIIAGAEAGYKLPWENKLVIGYDYNWVRRFYRPDAINTLDNKIHAMLKNSYFDFATFKLKYFWLDRGSKFGNQNRGTGPSDPAYILRFLRKYDATNKRQNSARAGADLYLNENLDLGFEFGFNKNTYDKTVIGRKRDTTYEGYADLEYRIPNIATLNAYFEIEKENFFSSHREFTTGATSADPNAAPTATNFNWSAGIDDNGWAYGVAVEVPVKDKIDLYASWAREKANGQINFLVQPGGTNQVRIPNYGDYRKNILEGRATYKFDEKFSTTLGYLWERRRLNDAQWNGYSVTETTVPFFTAPNNWFLTRAYNDYNYNVNVIYGMVSMNL
ncbi:MAG TPA: MtrB/PioB family outer membrane beta-barrel protein, partial [Bdellovibrionota bacterium]|nr:MtrB/PioB family outer membrane beta-barrel protein [Bdellovibrionota bacterium]